MSEEKTMIDDTVENEMNGAALGEADTATDEAAEADKAAAQGKTAREEVQEEQQKKEQQEKEQEEAQRAALETAEKAKIEAAEKALSKRFSILLAVGGCAAAVAYGLWVFGFFG